MQHCKVSITYLHTTEVFFLRQFRTLRPPGIYLCINITWCFFNNTRSLYVAHTLLICLKSETPTVWNLIIWHSLESSFKTGVSD